MSMGILAAVIAAVVALWVACLVLFWLARPRGVPVREVIGTLPDVLRLLRGLVTDPSVPLDVRIVLVALIAWIVSPIDLIPEFVPVLGPLDDVVVAIAALRYVRRRVGSDALRARWRGSDAGFAVLARIIGAGGAGGSRE
jgi:uncharacterized membrane protein YkvA (DUF1232 family)